MTIKTLEYNGIIIIHLKGDLIGENNGPELIHEAGKFVDIGKNKCIIEISELRYINSAGIGALITLLTRFRNKNGELIIVNPSELVKKLFIITKLNAIFTIENSVETAIQKLNNGN